MCTALVTMLKSRGGHEKIFFENIVAPEFTPERNDGITKTEGAALFAAFVEGGADAAPFAAQRWRLFT